MSGPIDAVASQVRPGADQTGKAAPGSDRERLLKLAAEFESSLMLQMLREMRRASQFSDDEQDGGLKGSESLFEMLDAELTSQLARAKSLGLAPQLVQAFDRMQGTPAAPADDAGSDAGVEMTEVATAAAQRAFARAAGHAGADAASSVAGSAADADHAVVPGNTVTSAFGWRRDPITGESRFHKGVDLKASYGQEVAATNDGTVLFAGSQGRYGTTVVVGHADGTRTRYAHLSVALVREGDQIAAGGLVGRAGSSGRATAPHLHFELLDRDGKPLNPLKMGKS